MITYMGKSVQGGIAMGRIKFLHQKTPAVKRVQADAPEVELKRLRSAVKKADGDLKELYQRAQSEVGGANAAIFEIHRMMLEDSDYIGSMEAMITAQGLNAEYAVTATGENFARMFADMDDAYMQGRAADVKDVSGRLVRILCGIEDTEEKTDTPYILAADDLTPSETVRLNKSEVLAFVTRKGSTGSHTAILARSMNIPALINVPVSEEDDGKTAAVDGFRGVLYLEPDEATTAAMRQKQSEEQEKQTLLETLKGKETLTADGKKIQLFANIGDRKDLAQVLQNDAEGIGLLRSEFLYLGRSDFPTEEELFSTYKQVLETLAGKTVVIRTLDIGADKQAGYFGLDREENPAMGMRAIRICLSRPEIFKTQLRALLRASVYGNLSVMYPMITSLDEVRRAKALMEEAAAELTAEGLPFQMPKQGIMIETPAAVMLSDILAKEVDFFSIGSNDLTQYTLAIDRQNDAVDSFFNPHSEAILRMIALTVKNGHKAGIWVGICGELGADLTVTERLLQMGMDEFSVSAAAVLPLRKRISECPSQ